MVIGIQLYTLRESTKNLYDFSETLKKVADVGYTAVQVSGTCEYEPQWLADQLKENGLKCVLTHSSPKRILNDTVKLCEDHKIFGCRNIGLGSMGRNFTLEKYDEFVKKYKPAISEIAKNGCKFFFHNHCEELKKHSDGTRITERLIRDFSPEELNITLDTYWVAYAGYDPSECLQKLKGRVECIHLKDMIIDPAAWEHRMAPVGYGNMNFERIIDTAEKCGTEYLLVEQDDCYDDDPFDCVKKSYQYLKSLGLK